MLTGPATHRHPSPDADGPAPEGGSVDVLLVAASAAVGQAGQPLERGTPSRRHGCQRSP